MVDVIQFTCLLGVLLGLCACLVGLLYMLFFPLRRQAVEDWLRYHKRVIYDREETSPYLTRYYLIGRPKMPDGSPPFDSIGRVREGAVWPRGWGLYVHCFHRSDSSDDLHSHPWQWALSWILKGGYSEERRSTWVDRFGNEWHPKGMCDPVIRREVRPGHFNFLKSNTFHRVDLFASPRGRMAEYQPCWSLFLAGPKFTSWGFWNRETGQFTPWREYLGLDPKLPEDY